MTLPKRKLLPIEAAAALDNLIGVADDAVRQNMAATGTQRVATLAQRDALGAAVDAEVFVYETRTRYKKTATGWDVVMGPLADGDVQDAIDASYGINAGKWIKRGQTPAQMTAGLRAAIAAAKAQHQSEIVLPAFEIVLDSEVNIDLVDCHLRGSGGACWVGPEAGWGPTGTIISGVAGVTNLLNLQFGEGNGYNYGSFSIEGVTLLNRNGAQSAIKTSSRNGPPRPVNFQHCTFIDFPKKLFVDSNYFTALGNINMIGCTFRSTDAQAGRNDYAVYASGPGAMVNWEFRGNAAEQGGRIFAHIMGPCVVENNIIEGQDDFVELHLDGAQLRYGGQYLEHNGGAITFNATNWHDTMQIEPSYTINNVTVYGKITRGQVWNRDVLTPWRASGCIIHEWALPTLGVDRAANAPVVVTNTLMPGVLEGRARPAGTIERRLPNSVPTRVGSGWEYCVQFHGTTVGLPSGMQTGPNRAIVAALRVNSPGETAVFPKWYDQNDNLVAQGRVDILPGEQIIHTVLHGVQPVITAQFRWDFPDGFDLRVGETTFYAVDLPSEYNVPEPIHDDINNLPQQTAWRAWQKEVLKRTGAGVPLYCTPGTALPTLDIAAVPAPMITGVTAGIIISGHNEEWLGATERELIGMSYAALYIPGASLPADGVIRIRVPAIEGYVLVGADWHADDGDTQTPTPISAVGGGYIATLKIPSASVYEVTVRTRWLKL